MASRGSLDALLGRLLQDGEELELRGGLNFIGITLTPNEANDVYDVEIDPASITAPGSTTQVVYNLAGVLTGASGVTIASGHAITATGGAADSVATQGAVRLGASSGDGGIWFRNDDDDANIGTFLGTDDVMYVGIGAAGANLYGDSFVNLQMGASGVASILMNSVVKWSFSSTTLSGQSYAGSGTVPALGTFRSAYNTTVLGVKDSGGTDREAIRIGSTGTDELALGNTAALHVWAHIKASTGAFGVWDGTSQLFKVTPAGTVFASSGGVLTGVTSINGAAPLAPVEGVVLLDSNGNIVVANGSQIRIPTLTANRTYDINNDGAIDEETITLYRTGTEAFTATIRDHADATIATFPASTKLAGVFRKATGGNFVHVGWQRLA